MIALFFFKIVTIIFFRTPLFMKIKKMQLALFLVFAFIQLSAQIEEPEDSSNYDRYVRDVIIEDDPSKMQKWSIGAGFGLYLIESETKSILQFQADFRFNPVYDIDFRFTGERYGSPTIENGAAFTDSKIVVHKRFRYKTTRSVKRLITGTIAAGGVFYINIPQNRFRTIDFDFGLGQFQRSSLYKINPGSDSIFPTYSGNARYTSALVGLSYKVNRNVKYRVGNDKYLSLGYSRIYFNLGYAMLANIKSYSPDGFGNYEEISGDQDIDINRLGWTLGYEWNQRFFSIPVSSWIGLEVGGRPHFHSNKEEEGENGSNLVFSLSFGLRFGGPTKP